MFAHVSWVVKSIIEAVTMIEFVALWLMIATFFGLCLNVVEHGVPGTSLTETWNSIWCVIVAQSALGYGDYTPQTHAGRFIIALSIVSGVAILSMIMMKSQMSLEFTEAESSLYRKICYKEGAKKYLSKLGVELLQRWWKLVIVRRKMCVRLKYVRNFHRLLSLFRLNYKKVEALKSITFEEDVESFGESVVARLQSLSVFLNELSGISYQAQRLVTNEFSLLNKTRSISSWCRKRLQVTPSPASPEKPMLHIDTKRSSQNSIRFNNTAVMKLKRQKARDKAFKKLQMKLAGDASPFTAIFTLGFSAAARGSMDSSMRDFSSVSRESESAV